LIRLPYETAKLAGEQRRFVGEDFQQTDPALIDVWMVGPCVSLPGKASCAFLVPFLAAEVGYAAPSEWLGLSRKSLNAADLAEMAGHRAVLPG